MASICRLCGEEKKLIKAHIFPKWIFSIIKEETDYLVVLSDDGSRPKRSRIGAYDPNILCKSCDNSFSNFENYAKEFFTSQLSVSKSYKSGKKFVGVSTIDEFDYEKLTKFVASLLFKSSISSREGFEKISIGDKYLHQMKQILTNECFSKTDPLCFNMVRFRPTPDIPNVEKSFVSPSPFRDKGIKWIMLRILDWQVRVKLDKRKAPAILEPYLMKKGRPLDILVGDYKDTKEFKLAEELVMLGTSIK